VPKAHDHYGSGHNIKGAIYNGLNNLYIRYSLAKRIDAWTHPIKAAKSYIHERFGHPKKQVDENIRPLVDSVRGHVNTKGHHPGGRGTKRGPDTIPFVDVVGRQRNMDGIGKIYDLTTEFNGMCSEDDVKWQFDNLPNDMEYVHLTPTGKSLPIYRLRPTDESIKKYNPEELQNSVNTLAAHMSRDMQID
jgi:hypothetical protein